MPGSIVFGPRSLAKLLLQNSAIRSSELEAAIDNELLTEEEATDLDLSGKATKVAGALTLSAEAVSSEDAAAAAEADAAAQTGAYVQADVQTIATLANELKGNYNSAVTLLNELKTKHNSLRDDVDDIMTKLNSMNA